MNQNLPHPLENEVGNMWVVYFTRVPARDVNGNEISNEYWAICNHCDPANPTRYKHRCEFGFRNLFKHMKTKHLDILYPPQVAQYDPTDEPPPTPDE